MQNLGMNPGRFWIMDGYITGRVSTNSSPKTRQLPNCVFFHTIYADKLHEGIALSMGKSKGRSVILVLRNLIVLLTTNMTTLFWRKDTIKAVFKKEDDRRE
jgi:hypothetical protein